MPLVQGTDTYATLSEANTFLEVYPPTNAWNTAPDIQKEAAMRAASRILDSHFVFKSTTASETQPMMWPRETFTYFDKFSKRDVTVTNGEYPDRLKWAQIELANHIMTFPAVFIGDNQTFERIKIGPIEVEDTNADISTVPLITSSIHRWLRPLLANEGQRLWWRAW